MFLSGILVIQGLEREGMHAGVTYVPTFDDARGAHNPLSLGLTEGGIWLITAWVSLSLHCALIADSLQDPPGFMVEVPGIEGFIHIFAPLTVGFWFYW